MACFWGLLAVTLGGLGYMVHMQIEEDERVRKQKERLKVQHAR